MIDWQKSAELNNCSISDLKLRFERFPKSNKKVVVICDNCKKSRLIRFSAYRDLCNSCSLKDKYVGINNPLSKPKITLICEICGNEFEVISARRNTAKFCSYKCAGKWQSINRCGENHPQWKGGLITLTCKQCRNEYKIPPSHILNSNFCSQKCSSKWKSENIVGDKNPLFKSKIILTCKMCNKNFSVSPCNNDRSKFCCKECHNKWMSINQSGENASNWQGGISFEIYPQEFNNQLRQLIRNKYNNCDYISGIYKNICNPNRELDVHHVNYDKQNCNENNLIPLNSSNHTKTNTNRSFWNRLFIYSLEYDEEYYNDNKNNIWEMI